MGLYETHILPFLMGIPIQQEALDYQLRVEADGGAVVDFYKVNLAFHYLKKHSLLTSCLHFSSALGGVKKDAQGKVSKLYCLVGNDAAQATASKQPVWNAGVLTYDHLSHSALVFAQQVVIPVVGNSSAYFRFVPDSYGRVFAGRGGVAVYIRLFNDKTLTSQADSTGVANQTFNGAAALGVESKAWQTRQSNSVAMLLNGESSTIAPSSLMVGDQTLAHLGQYSVGNTTLNWQGQINTAAFFAAALTAVQREEIEKAGL